MKSKFLAVALVVLGVGATLAGLYGQVFLREDEGHHDGRVFSFALESQSGADELVVEPSGPNSIRVGVERAGQPLGLDKIHGDLLQVFVVGRNLDSFSHVASGEVDDGTVAVSAPAGEGRVIVQASPSGGPDLLELATSVTVEGQPGAALNVSDNDEWTDGELTVRRQGFDFILSEPWNGDDVYDGPALLSLFRAEDLAFTHAHGEVVGDNRFSFATNLPGTGDYLAALEFEQNDELVTALFRFTI